MSVLNVIGTFAGEHAPEILVGVGIIGFVATTVLACKSTAKMHDILEKGEAEEEEINNKEIVEEGDDIYTEEDKKKDLKDHKRKMRIRIVRNYAVPAAVGVASVAAILVGFKVLNGRYLVTASALATLSEAHERYRKRNIELNGEDSDYYCETGMRRTEELKEVKTVDPETGEEKTEIVVEKKLVQDDPYGGPYYRQIGPNTYLWEKFHGDLKMIETQLAISEAAYNEKYGRGDYVNFNNDVIHDLFAGKGKTDIGAISGRCRYDKEAENRLNQPYIDLGCFEYDERGRRHLKLIETTTMEGENIMVPFIKPNFTTISFANIAKVRDNFEQADKDKVRIRRKGGKYISQEAY